MSTPDGLAYYGQFADLAPLLATIHDLEMALYAGTEDLLLLLPDDVLPGVTSAYGHRVVRAAVPEPMVGVRPFRLR